MQKLCEMVQSLLKTTVSVQRAPYHALNIQALNVLQKEGLIRGFVVEGNRINILLKHYLGAPVIRDVTVVSRPVAKYSCLLMSSSDEPPSIPAFGSSTRPMGSSLTAKPSKWVSPADAYLVSTLGVSDGCEKYSFYLECLFNQKFSSYLANILTFHSTYCCR